MDGFKERLNASIRVKLSLSLSLAILVVAVVAGLFSFVSAFDQAHALQDDTLKQVAALFDRHHLPLTQPGDDGRANDSDEESRVIVQSLGDSGKALTPADGGMALTIPLTLPPNLADGLHTLNSGNEPFRVLVKTMAGGARIAVAQETGVRNEIARASALRTVMPFLILVPILLLIVANLVRKMFRPIAALSTEIDQRAEQELHPVAADHVPVEVRPFVVAINRLLARVGQSMEVQRRFIADAAHELRSPLTAMSLQAERLAEADMSDLARERLATLQRGIERGRNLLNQLLTLAKAQATPERPTLPVSVQAIYRRVLEDLMPLADTRRIDIGVEGGQDAQVMVSELDMIALVRNLVDNAIRYTQHDGRIDLSVTTEGAIAVLRIQDNGPGIALAERERVFDPFYRTLGSDQVGSGLGMSIVKAISDRIGAQITLGVSDAVTGSGLRVCLRIPLAQATRGSLPHTPTGNT
ncbi:sensor histidine kinase [Actimicrobium antarcticum]|uniref:histidine kinase n=1 Tax=Actimicrobium antarcticum TaxID=1051899 RepID=A0ABP7TD65_9BURK